MTGDLPFRKSIMSCQKRSPNRNVFRYLPDPTILLDNYEPNSKINTYAALIEKNEKQAIVVADSDLTANYLWVRVQDFYGEQVWTFYHLLHFNQPMLLEVL